mmetsp:Transcript_21081/g.25530  ORF Transcript_21081/g.25530 Transcript_21081/m.25530 type:complete len:268 (-) Transcript_21081:99-902(-)
MKKIARNALSRTTGTTSYVRKMKILAHILREELDHLLILFNRVFVDFAFKRFSSSATCSSSSSIEAPGGLRIFKEPMARPRPFFLSIEPASESVASPLDLILPTEYFISLWDLFFLFREPLGRPRPGFGSFISLWDILLLFNEPFGRPRPRFGAFTSLRIFSFLNFLHPLGRPRGRFALLSISGLNFLGRPRPRFIPPVPSHRLTTKLTNSFVAEFDERPWSAFLRNKTSALVPAAAAKRSANLGYVFKGTYSSLPETATIVFNLLM